MRRMFAIAAGLGVLILPSGLQAQFRSAPRAAAPRSGFSGFRAAAPRAPGGAFSGFRSAPRPGVRAPGFAAAARRPRPFRGRQTPRPRNFFPQHHFIQFPFGTGFNNFGFPSAYWYALPPYYYPPLTDEWENDNFDNQPSAAAAEPAPAAEDDALAQQVETLTDEVAELAQGRGARSSAPVNTPPQGSNFEEKAVPAVFVYRDGHQLEAQNYAIMGQTLWVFGDQITRRVSLADLDIAQTRKLNDERGIDFVPPELR